MPHRVQVFNCRSNNQNYEAFKSQYKQDGKKFVSSSWSGKSLYEMINCLNNNEQKSELMKGYRLVVNMNNNFLHPTFQSLRQSILNYREGKIDHKYTVMQLHSIIITMHFIMDKFLEYFSKGRPAFKKQFSDIKDGHNAIVDRAKSTGLLDT
jgi:hypothetical protein